MLTPRMTDAWLGSLAVSWPRAPWSRGKIDARVAEQTAAVDAAKARARAMENRVRLAVQEAYVRAKAAQERALLLRTTIGLHTRAAASDFGTARLLGVRANRVIAVSVVLSGLIAAAVAVMTTVQLPLVTPDFALRDTIVVLVGVVVGGIDRLWTATLGGFAIGFVSGLINGLLPTDKTVYLPSAVFALVILVLLLRPAGLFATRGRNAEA